MLRPGFKSCLQDSRAPAGLSKASLVSSLQPILVTTSAAGSVGCSLTDPSPRHQLPVLQLNSVPTASAWSWHRTPQVKGCPHLRLRGPITRPDPSMSKPHPPPLPLGLIICAVPHRTQEGPLFTRSPVFYKRMQLGNSPRKTSTGRGMGEGVATPLPGAPGPAPPVYTNLEAPWTSKGRFWVCFLFFFFTQARLIGH